MAGATDGITVPCLPHRAKLHRGARACPTAMVDFMNACGVRLTPTGLHFLSKLGRDVICGEQQDYHWCPHFLLGFVQVKVWETKKPDA